MRHPVDRLLLIVAAIILQLWEYEYRVSRLVMQKGVVNMNLKCHTLILVLARLVKILQKWLGNLTRKWNALQGQASPCEHSWVESF